MIDGAMVALGISPEGRPVPIQLTAAGLLAVSGGSGGAGNGAFVGGYTLIGIAPDGTRVPIAVDSNGIIQTSGGGGDDSIAHAANTVQAGPTSGAAALPTFRALVGADLPATITKATSFTANGALSAPALTVAGTVVTGGSATTTKPLVLFEPTGTVSTGWSTAGTMLGVNAPSGFTGNLFDFQLNGVSKYAIQVIAGTLPQLNMHNGTVGNPTLLWSSGVGLFQAVSNKLDVCASGVSNIRLGDDGLGIRSGLSLYWGALGAGDTTLTRSAAGVVGIQAALITSSGAASLPALSITGIPFAGTTTNSFPLLYLNNSGATAASGTLNANGTVLGINSHGTPDLMNLMVDGASNFIVSGGFNVQFRSGNTTTPTIVPIAATTTGIAFSTVGTIFISSGSNASFVGSAGFIVNSSNVFGWTSSSDPTATRDTTILRLAAASLQLGAAANATPMAYTLTVGESSRSGTDSNVAGAGATFQPGAGTGTGATVPFVLKAPVQVASGTGAQTQTEWARGQAVGTAIGCSFFGVASVVRQTVGANVNNVAASGTTGQFDDFTNGTVYATDYVALHATVYQLTRSVAQLTAALRNYGLGV